jgi:hypothetical protein
MKYFCPECKMITFSLRYMRNEGRKTRWEKPDGELQWCISCKKPIPAKECVAGLAKLLKGGGRK